MKMKFYSVIAAFTCALTGRLREPGGDPVELDDKRADALAKAGCIDPKPVDPPKPKLDENGLMIGGPTPAEYVAAGYTLAGYPPEGWAPVWTPEERAKVEAAKADKAAADAAEKAAADAAEKAAADAADKAVADAAEKAAKASPKSSK